MAENSFDTVSEIQMPELRNAVDQTKREMDTRFDFKGSRSDIELSGNEIILTGDSEGRIRQILDILHSKMIKRGVAIQSLKARNPEPASGGIIRQKFSLIQGIDAETSRRIHSYIKDSGIKVRSQTMDGKVRVTGKSKDDLQAVMNLLREKIQDVALQFNNFR